MSYSLKGMVQTHMLCNFIEIALRHGCSPVNLLYIFRTPFPKNTSEGKLLLQEVNTVTLSNRSSKNSKPFFKTIRANDLLSDSDNLLFKGHTTEFFQSKDLQQ